MKFLNLNIIAIAITLLASCGEKIDKTPLESAVIQLDSILVVVNGFPLDSILAVRERLDIAKNDVRWLGLDSNITFIRSDAPIIAELSKASRFLKDAPSRIQGLINQCGKSLNQIEGLISVTELLRQLSNVKVGEKVFLNTETEITEELQQTLKRHLEKNS